MTGSKKLTHTEFTTQIDNIPVGNFLVTITSVHDGLASLRSNPVMLKVDFRGRNLSHHVVITTWVKLQKFNKIETSKLSL